MVEQISSDKFMIESLANNNGKGVPAVLKLLQAEHAWHQNKTAETPLSQHEDSSQTIDLVITELRNGNNDYPLFYLLQRAQQCADEHKLFSARKYLDYAERLFPDTRSGLFPFLEKSSLITENTQDMNLRKRQGVARIAAIQNEVEKGTSLTQLLKRNYYPVLVSDPSICFAALGAAVSAAKPDRLYFQNCNLLLRPDHRAYLSFLDEVVKNPENMTLDTVIELFKRELSAKEESITFNRVGKKENEALQIHSAYLSRLIANSNQGNNIALFEACMRYFCEANQIPNQNELTVVYQKCCELIIRQGLLAQQITSEDFSRFVEDHQEDSDWNKTFMARVQWNLYAFRLINNRAPVIIIQLKQQYESLFYTAHTNGYTHS